MLRKRSAISTISRSTSPWSGSLQVTARLISRITARFEMLANRPFLGRARDRDLGPGKRSHVVGDFVIIYRVDDPDIVVLRVIHGRREINMMTF